MSENVSPSISPTEAVEEKVSLSDRFGLILGFYPFSQDQFFEMIINYKNNYKIPISDDSFKACKEFNLEPTTIALSGGEDYQLLFTVGQENLEKIQNNLNLSVIGHITSSKEMILMEKSGRNIMIESLGWKSF